MLTQEEAIRRLFLPGTTRPEIKDKVAVIVSSNGSEHGVTNMEFEQLLAGTIEELRERGVKANDKVVLCAKNSVEFSAAVLACWALNAMAALVDFRSTPTEILNILKKTDCQTLVTSKNLYADFKTEEKRFKDEHINVIELSTFAKHTSTPAKIGLDPSTIDLDKPAFTILTSGTTGKPKAAVHDLRSLFLNLVDLSTLADLNETKTGVMPLPISHIFGLEVFLISRILSMKIVLTELDPVNFIKAIAKHKPEFVAALPQFFGALLSAPEGVIDLKDSLLLLCGGAPLTSSLANKFKEKFGARLNNGYGSTESKIVALNKDGPTHSVGQVVQKAHIDIVDDKDNVLPLGATGEVRISGPTLMGGYLDNDEETQKVLHHGHYHTGDIGCIEDGYLFIIGRKSEMVIVDGAVVYSGEIEAALRDHTAVREVAIIPEPDEKTGQRIKACVVLNESDVVKKLSSSNQAEQKEASEKLQSEFEAFCRENLKPQMQPKVWEFFGPHDTLPKTLAGKTDKKSLQTVQPC